MTWHVVPDTNAIFTRTAIPQAILEDIPHARDSSFVVLENTYANWSQLTERGLVLPPPVHGVKWSGRYLPRKHQLDGIAFLISTHKGALLHDTGVGKTLTTCWAIDYLLKEKVINRVVVLAPLSVCNHVWQRTFFLEFPHLRTAVVQGDAKRKKLIASDTSLQVIIVNYESLHIVKDAEVDLVVLDESTKIKTPSTKAFKIANTLCEHKRTWLLTGTPTPQGPMDAYGQIRLLQGYFMSMTRWRLATMRQVTQFKWVPLPNADQTVAKHFVPAHRVAGRDCYDVPEIDIIPVEYDLTDAQKKTLKGLIDEARAEVEGKTITATNAAHVLTKTLQTYAGGVYGDEKIEHRVDAQPFFDRLHDLVDAADTPVLVFCSYRVNAHAVHDYLVSKGLDTALITGDTPSSERGIIFDKVQASQVKALVAVPTTMSHGITLTTARHVVWVTPPFSNEVYQQSIARVVRIGQRNAVKVYQMIGGKAVSKLFAVLEDRAKLQDAVLDLLGE